MKATDRNIYHIFTLGFCGAPENGRDESETVNRLQKVTDLTDYLKELNINTILFGPLNESTSHGYDTIDYKKLDHRLGSNQDLKETIKELKDNGFDVIFDCVFNHVGRDHFAFQDLLQNRENSRYKDWFQDVNFGWNNSYNDGFSYANWAGHDELVKLNLWNPEVRDYLKDILNYWIEEYDIDGVRMDAANVMDRGFLSELADMAHSKKEDFIMIGEIVGGNYEELVQNGHLDSFTDYECYKGLYSSLNSKNYFEIAHSIRRLFDGNGGLVRGIPAANFVDNHDVERVASTIRDKKLLEPLYILFYTMPGFPTVYYGSEVAQEGKKEWGSDRNLRPAYETINFDSEHPLFKLIAKLGKLRNDYPVLKEGYYQELFILPEQYGFKRIGDEEAVILLNMNENNQTVNVNLNGNFNDILNDEELTIDNSVNIPAMSGRILVQGNADER